MLLDHAPTCVTGSSWALSGGGSRRFLSNRSRIGGRQRIGGRLEIMENIFICLICQAIIQDIIDFRYWILQAASSSSSSELSTNVIVKPWSSSMFKLMASIASLLSRLIRFRLMDGSFTAGTDSTSRALSLFAKSRGDLVSTKEMIWVRSRISRWGFFFTHLRELHDGCTSW